MDQVITNLVGNALKYGRGKPIEIAIAIEGEDAVVRVVDHGIGIGADEQRRLFERFERAVSTREFGGFGLGLWICRQIVEASGGQIAVESTLGEGSTFTVTLPLATSPSS
jgi:signal transduction histidine kinase